MRNLDAILNTHPRTDERLRSNRGHLADALSTCADVCTVCADACLAEEKVALLRRCIRLNHECADACRLTARSALRLDEADANLLRPVVTMCLAALQTCREECERHTMHEHCRITAATCRDGMRRCNEFLGLIADTGVGTSPALARDL